MSKYYYSAAAPESGRETASEHIPRVKIASKAEFDKILELAKPENANKTYLLTAAGNLAESEHIVLIFGRQQILAWVRSIKNGAAEIQIVRVLNDKQG